jgi:hypothetical protein
MIRGAPDSASAEARLYPCDEARDLLHPGALLASAGATEERTHVVQNGVTKVEQLLKRLEAEQADGKTPREPLGSRQTTQHFGYRFAAGIHRAIGLQRMDDGVGIPDIEVRIERAKFGRVIAYGARIELWQSRSLVRVFLHPLTDAVAYRAGAIEKQQGPAWVSHVVMSTLASHTHERMIDGRILNGCVTTAMTLDSDGCMPSTSPTSRPSRNIMNVGVPCTSKLAKSSGSAAILTRNICSLRSRVSDTCCKKGSIALQYPQRTT